MKLTQITTQSIKKVSNREVLNLHYRIHQLWGQRKTKKIDTKLLREKHDIVVIEMKRRGMNHTTPLLEMSVIDRYLLESNMKLDTKSPCNGICTMKNDKCEGCKRTKKEISNWMILPKEERHEINKRIKE